jgi:hypothetical protein
MTLRLRYTEALRIAFALIWRQIVWSGVAVLPAVVVLWEIARRSPTSAELMGRIFSVAGPFLFLIGSIPAVWGALRTRYEPFTLELHRCLKHNTDLIEEDSERRAQQAVVLTSGFVCAFIVIFAAVLMVKLHDLRMIREEEPGRQYYDYDRDVNRKALAISTSSGMQSAVLASPVFPDAAIRAFWTQDGKFLLMGQAVAFPGPGREFQLWAEPRKGGPISLGMLRIQIKGELLHVTELPLKPVDLKTIFITGERWGGQTRPSTAPIWSARVETANSNAGLRRTGIAQHLSSDRGSTD